MSAPRRKSTYDDLLKVPEPLVAEIVGGELVTSPRPAIPHALASSVMGGQLMESFHRPPGGAGVPGGWWILDEPELHLGEDVLVPDLAGWRRERVPALGDQAAMTIAPDWACEVVSPATAALDRGRKMPIYAREQVRHLWLVDPGARTLEVYRLADGHWIVASTHGGSASVRAAPFEAVELEIARWWGEA